MENNLCICLEMRIDFDICEKTNESVVIFFSSRKFIDRLKKSERLQYKYKIYCNRIPETYTISEAK